MSLFAVCGRANYTNLSRYSPLSERTFRRNFNEGIALEPINHVTAGNDRTESTDARCGVFFD